MDQAGLVSDWHVCINTVKTRRLLVWLGYRRHALMENNNCSFWKINWASGKENARYQSDESPKEIIKNKIIIGCNWNIPSGPMELTDHFFIIWVIISIYWYCKTTIFIFHLTLFNFGGCLLSWRTTNFGSYRCLWKPLVN